MTTQVQEGTIGNWSASTLIKVMQEMFQNLPTQQFSNLESDTLTVSDELIVEDKITFLDKPYFRKVGANGEPAFTNAWVNVGGANQVAGFWKDPLGFVHLRGRISTGTIGNAAFTLPPGYRPALDEIFPVVSNAAFGAVSVTSGGVVTPTVGSNTYVSLSGISFKAA